MQYAIFQQMTRHNRLLAEIGSSTLATELVIAVKTYYPKSEGRGQLWSISSARGPKFCADLIVEVSLFAGQTALYFCHYLKRGRARSSPVCKILRASTRATVKDFTVIRIWARSSS